MSNVPIWPSALVHGQPDMMAGKQIEMPPTGLGITNDLANQQTIAPHRFTHQPDLYLQLSQILECEISNHIQTRAELLAETTRRSELENQVWKQLQDISEWQNACQTVYSSLDQHRAEAARLKLELDVANAELATLKVSATNSSETNMCSPKSEPFSPNVNHAAPAVWSGRSHRTKASSAAHMDEDEGAERESWCLDFVRDLEEHLRSHSE